MRFVYGREREYQGACNLDIAEAESGPTNSSWKETSRNASLKLCTRPEVPRIASVCISHREMVGAQIVLMEFNNGGRHERWDHGSGTTHGLPIDREYDGWKVYVAIGGKH